MASGNTQLVLLGASMLGDLTVPAGFSGTLEITASNPEFQLNGTIFVENGGDPVTLNGFQAGVVSIGAGATGIRLQGMYVTNLNGDLTGKTFSMQNSNYFSSTTAPLVLGGATSVDIRGSLINADTDLIGAVSGTVTGNNWINSVVTLDAPALVVTDNYFNGFTGVAVVYRAAGTFDGNTLSSFATALQAESDFGTTGRNLIENSDIGAELFNDVTLSNTDFRDISTIGITGDGRVWANGFDDGVVIEDSGTGVSGLSGDIRYLTVRHSTIGVQASSDQDILNSVFFQTSDASVIFDGVDRGRMNGVSILTHQGDGVRVIGGATQTEMVNTVIEVHDGFGLYLEGGSESGFFADYNLYHAEGTGNIAWFTRTFSDMLAWKLEQRSWDQNSNGTTAINPTLAKPNFEGRGHGDLRLRPTVAGQRVTSLGAEAGDAAGIADRDGLTPNLLANGDFTNGLTDWTVNVAASTNASGGFDDAPQFVPGTTEVGFAEQNVTLDLATFSATGIDSGAFDVVFGGRILGDGRGPFADAGSITLIMLDENGVQIGDEFVLEASNVNDRWERVSDRVELLTGTRELRFRFEGTREGTGALDSFLSRAFLQVVGSDLGTDVGAYPESARVNDGTSDEARIALRYPDLYTDWEVGEPMAIEWETFGNTGGSSVRIELLQDGPDGPVVIDTIAGATSDSGSYNWTPQDNGLTFGTFGLRIQVSLVTQPAVFDRSVETFAVPEDGLNYYINDGSTAGDVHTTAAGDYRNTGKLASAPKASVIDTFAQYDIGAGSQVRVDTGAYEMFEELVLSGTFDFGLGL
ncbi:MAG: Ser-Thr-rich GPI-anchored membrane family protein, partial [Pseudomonadota bacterium]